MQIHMLDGSSLSVVDEQIVAARQRQQRSYCWWPARPSRTAVAALLLSAIVVVVCFVTLSGTEDPPLLQPKQRAGHRVLSAEVTFIRHGMSCGNAVSWKVSQATKDALHELAERLGDDEFDDASDLAESSVRDPPLTQLGVEDSQRARLAFVGRGDDFVGSSTLRRARETATHMFPGRTIAVLPVSNDTLAAWRGVS